MPLECRIRNNRCFLPNGMEVKYFHATHKNNLSNILKEGLKPSIGEEGSSTLNLGIANVLGYSNYEVENASEEEYKAMILEYKKEVGNGFVFLSEGIEGLIYTMNYMQWEFPKYAILGIHPDCNSMISDEHINMEYEVVSHNTIPPRCLVLVKNLKYL